jgi:hypothetical protein
MTLNSNFPAICGPTFRELSPDATVLISARQSGANYRPSEVVRAFAALDCTDRKQTYLIVRTFGHGIAVSITELHRLADKLNISDQVTSIAVVEYSQLPGLYAASDIAINFPIMDAFPVTFLECFSCGLPRSFESADFLRVERRVALSVLRGRRFRGRAQGSGRSGNRAP